MASVNLKTKAGRSEFLAALKTNKIEPEMVKKITASAVSAFENCKIEDIVFLLTHPKDSYSEFGRAVLRVSEDPAKITKVRKLHKEAHGTENAPALLSALAASGSSEPFEIVAKSINSQNEQTRKKALDLFLNLDGWSAKRELVSAFLEDPSFEVRSRVLLYIARKAPKLYASYLRHHSSEDQVEVRKICLAALISMKNPKNTQTFLERIPHEDGKLQGLLFGAVLDFTEKNSLLATEGILKSLTFPDAAVRKSAMYFFLQLEDQPTSIRALLDYCQALDTSVRDSVFAETVEHKDVIAELVLHVLETDSDPKRRAQALSLASVLKHEKLTELFLKELTNSDWVLRCLAMRTLGEMKCKEAIPSLLEALQDKEVSIAAIEALSKYGDMKIAQEFFKKLSKATEPEQLEILEALLEMSDKRFIEPLVKFMESDKSEEKAKLRTEEAIRSICKATKTPVPKKIFEIKKAIKDKRLSEIPDLGLSMVDEI